MILSGEAFEIVSDAPAAAGREEELRRRSPMLQGRYQILFRIGAGGMGSVYEAIDQRLGHRVALKETRSPDAARKAAFEGEARLLASLTHPALPVVSDHFAEGDAQYLVMQYIPGDDLGRMSERQVRPFPAAEVCEWADQILDALEYLHGQSPPVYHLDIKPQNLKLAPGRKNIFLLDFGLAKVAGDGEAGHAFCSIEGFTPRYSPPEQAKGERTGPRSDLYALGATLYRLLTGKQPASAIERMRCALGGRPDPLRPAAEACAHVPRELSDVLQKAMRYLPERRYESAAEMREALRHASSLRVTEGVRPSALAAERLGATFIPTITPELRARMEEAARLASASGSVNVGEPATRKGVNSPGWGRSLFLRDSPRRLDGVPAASRPVPAPGLFGRPFTNWATLGSILTCMITLSCYVLRPDPAPPVRVLEVVSAAGAPDVEEAAPTSAGRSAGRTKSREAGPRGGRPRGGH